jgi:KaiC/GvpD/RAD55 family RecA-like ATPase
MGVTCIFTYQSRRISLPDRIMGMGISSLIDTTILLHYAEEDDRLHRTLLVLKSRGMNHSLSQHRFRITENGLCFEHDPDGAATEGRSY